VERFPAFGFVLLLACPAVSPALADTWTEQGDAGELIPTAQVPTGTNPLTLISGSLLPQNDVDLYLIRINDPRQFAADTGGSDVTDTQLFLFSGNGNGVTFNDDDPLFLIGLHSRISGTFIPGPGDYYLGISAYDRDAVNGPGLEIWLDEPFTVERPPDGPGAPGPLAGWDGFGGDAGNYVINISGGKFVPEPAAMAVLALGGLAVLRRRR